MKAIDYVRKGWTQGKFALDKNGWPELSTSPFAVCWCAVGAINAAYDHTSQNEYNEACNKLELVIGQQDITKWNDNPSRTHEEVIEAFERAGI